VSERVVLDLAVEGWRRESATGELFFLIWRLKDGGGNWWCVVLDLAVAGWWRELQVSCLLLLDLAVEGWRRPGITGELLWMCLLKDGGGNHWLVVLDLAVERWRRESLVSCSGYAC